jgi:uncharacterized protein YhhL (DUF1145 family)
LLCEDSFGARFAADKEALLIYIVGVALVNLVLSHPLMKESKVRLVSLFVVSVVALVIALFSGKFARMAL